MFLQQGFWTSSSTRGTFSLVFPYTSSVVLRLFPKLAYADSPNISLVDSSQLFATFVPYDISFNSRPYECSSPQKVKSDEFLSKDVLYNKKAVGGQHSTTVAFALRTQPSRVRIWQLEKWTQHFFREPAVLKLYGVSALGKSEKVKKKIRRQYIFPPCIPTNQQVLES